MSWILLILGGLCFVLSLAFARRKQKLVIGVGLGFIIFGVIITVIPDEPTPKEPTPIKAFDFSEIRLSNPGCALKGPDGEAVTLREQNGKVLIPKGSTITGECFIVNKPNFPTPECRDGHYRVTDHSGALPVSIPVYAGSSSVECGDGKFFVDGVEVSEKELAVYAQAAMLLHREVREKSFLAPSGIPVIDPATLIDDICRRVLAGKQLPPELDQLIAACEEKL
ncbi:hypothetical protein [Vibrio sp. YT-17]|uniref:hypothetical protein n=1 Tax=Vibrio sp. YT-17 TaxID=3074708 RepID=UPI002964273A|nr:hypothetical protein [Vibrio sp. YT-17]MDW1542438.1 hypothetical protein [Vibrio sp. YT-17]